METAILENSIMRLDFFVIGKPVLEFPVFDPDTLKVKDHLQISLDDTPFEVFCVRWSNRPDLIAGVPEIVSDRTDVTEVTRKATKQLRILYTQKQIP